MEKYSTQSKWDKNKKKHFKPAKEPPSGYQPSKEVVSTGYEDYLTLLQERNRLLKKLKEKDNKQIELEKKEQGFSLYVNGANADLFRPQPPSTAKNRAQSRQTKTADAYSERRKQLEHELQWLEREVGEVRAKTAPIPDQAPRREWQPDSIQIKTNQGDKLKLKAPGVLSGNYSEDFDALDDNNLIDSYLNKSEELELDSDDEDELTLSMNDVETLRKSLEADQSIQESIKAAQDRIKQEEEDGVENSDDGEEIEEELEGASSSLNLAELDKLPHFNPENKDKFEEKKIINQSISFEIPANDKSKVKKEAHQIVKEKTFLKEATKPNVSSTRSGEDDMVVLSFSSSSKSKKARALSSTRRKEDPDSFVATSTPAKKLDSKKTEEDTSSKHGEKHKELTSHTSSRTRPLSASRRKPSTDDIEEDKNASEIFEAMALENQNIDSSSGCHTAPEKEKPKQQEESERPASIASTSHKISLATKKVRNMDPRQQQHLISLLSKLDMKGPLTKSASPLPSKKTSPMKATVSYSSMETASSLASSQGPDTVESSYVGLQDEDIIEVNIEILSNWGHPNTLGITEVQFYSSNGALLKYDPNEISVSGFFGDQGVVSNISNCKTKTNKPKYMWFCQFIPGSPVELMFHLPVNQQELTKIVIWNFNGGVKDLNMGVKDVRIFVGGELKWKGAIDKGCGNQVFDYSTIISLNELIEGSPPSIKPPIRCETVIVKKSCDSQRTSIGDLPVIEKSKDIPTTESYNQTTASKSMDPALKPLAANKSTEIVNKNESTLANSLSKRLVESGEGRLVTRSSSTPNLSSNSGLIGLGLGQDALRGDVAALPSKPPWLESSRKKSSRSRSSSRSKSRPIWLPDEEPSKQVEERSLSSTDMRGRESPPVQATARCRSTGARSYSLPGNDDTPSWPETFAARKDEQLPTCLDSDLPPDRSSSRQSRRSVPSPIPLAQNPSLAVNQSQENKQQESAKTKRHQWRMEQSLSLEESWNVLSMFERSHKGRITKDMDLGVQDDSLDKFLSNEGIKSEPKQDHPEDRTDYRPMQDGILHRSQEIPTLPKGKHLVINMLSTWGDKHYIGLNGIEIFTEYGKPARIQEITADPLDINILPDYGSDPRVVANLIDGIFRTRDDMHLWMAPYTAHQNHYIYITFTEPIKIAMVRIWNYNKSRIHSYRGAKDIQISLDDDLIFEGEIQRASGTLDYDEPFGDTILFTMDEEILEAMSLYDQTYEIPADEDSLIYSQEYDRPSTADREEEQESEDRPFTQARQRRITDEDKEHFETTEPQMEGRIPCGQVLELCFTATWGDPYYLGLTGLELFGPKMEIVFLSIEMMEANPRDLNDLPNYGDDDRTLDKIIDGSNVTTSDEHMWLIPFNEGEDHTLTIDLRQNTQLLGMRIWNYNKSPDDTFRGAKLVQVKLDGCILSPSDGFLLRKGPGNMYFDFAQDVYFMKSLAPTLSHASTGEPNRRPESRVNIKKLVPDYEPTLMPTGFVFQFQLLSSWGDPYYIGLNGLQFFDENGYRIHLTDNNITAYPHSVNVLDGVIDDIRTPDKLIDDVNDTSDGRHMWLAPICPGQKNLIFVIFDEPVTVSMVKIWNYSKTPIRGVQQFVLLVDDLLVYHGILPQVMTGSGILPGLDLPVSHHTVLFTDREQIAMAERKNVVRSIDMEQDVQLTNDKRIVTRYNDPKSAGKTADPALRPKTSVKLLPKKTIK